MSLQECNEQLQRLEAESDNVDLHIRTLLERRRELRRARDQKEDAINELYTAATVHGLTKHLGEMGDGSDKRRSLKTVLAVGNLIIKVTQLYKNDAHLPLIDVSACLEQAMKESNFRGKEFHLELNQYITDAFLRTIAPLLAHAEVLDLSYTTVSDISPLAGLKKLRRLYLREVAVTDLTPLSGLKGLKELKFSNASMKDISPLAGLHKMEELWLSDTAVSDITPLSGLKKLKVLSLWGTPVADITILSGLKKLKELYLNHTQVTDLSSLVGLSELEKLGLEGTRVPRYDAVMGELRRRRVNILWS